MSTCGNDRFFSAMLRNDFHPLTKKHPNAAFPMNRSCAKLLQEFHPPDRLESKDSLKSARSQISLAASRMQGTRKPKFQAGTLPDVAPEDFDSLS